MKRQIQRAVRIVGGSLLLLIGVIGGFVPVLQGWIFVIAGLTLLAPESKRARRALDWAKAKVKRGDHREREPVKEGESDPTQKKVETDE